MATEGAPGMPHPADTGVSRTERRIMLLERHVSALRQNSRLRRSLDVAVGDDTWTNETLTTTLTTFATVTLTRPEWATRALVMAINSVQLSNSSGGAQNVIAHVGIGGAVQQREMTVANGTTVSVSAPRTWDLTDLTDDVTINGSAAVNSGTNAANAGHLIAQALWLP
jgi:hypothetical protein